MVTLFNVLKLYQCCQNGNGYNYIHDKSSKCIAGGRDHQSVLSSLCKDGYSEAMNATQCIKCDRLALFGIFIPLNHYSKCVGFVL